MSPFRRLGGGVQRRTAVRLYEGDLQNNVMFVEIFFTTGLGKLTDAWKFFLQRKTPSASPRRMINAE